MSGILRPSGGDPTASAWQASAAQIAAMQNAAMHNQSALEAMMNAAMHNQSALEAMMNAADRGNMQWRPAPGIYWTRKTNRVAVVEIVRE